MLLEFIQSNLSRNLQNLLFKSQHFSNQNQSKLKIKITEEEEEEEGTQQMDLGRFPIISIIENMLEVPEEDHNNEKIRNNNPSRAYMRDAKAMAATPADVTEHANAYVFVVDMPGIKGEEIKVQIESENVLVVSGERQRENKEENVKYVRMERRMGKFMRKFQLPDDSDLDKISAACNEGVLRVTVQKLPPPQPKRPKTIQVQVS